MNVWWFKVPILLGALVAGLIVVAAIVLTLRQWRRRDRAELKRLILEQMLRAARRGLPLGEAIRALGDDLDRRSRRRKILWRRRVVAWLILSNAKLAERNQGLSRLAEDTYQIASALEDGSLEQALGSVPGLIAEPLCTLLGEAERRGTLLSALEDLGDMETSAREFRSRVRGLLCYPLAVLLMIAAAGGLIMGVIAPTLSRLDDVDLSTFVFVTQSFQTVFMLGVPALFALFWVGASSIDPGLGARTRFTRVVHFWFPEVRHAHQAARVSRFARTLAALLRAGLPAPDALRTAAPLAVEESTVVLAAARLADEGTPVVGALATTGALEMSGHPLESTPGDDIRVLADFADAAAARHSRLVLGVSGFVLPVSLLALGGLVASFYWPTILLSQRMMGQLW
jgi:type II secretory pathway component PulF